jgi:hypothetical protein
MIITTLGGCAPAVLARHAVRLTAKRLIVDNLMGFTFLERRGKEVAEMLDRLMT